MTRVLTILSLLGGAAIAQVTPPAILVGRDAPPAAACAVGSVGAVYVRSEDPANGPIHVLRCTQSGPINYSWQPIDHFVGATLPAKCSVGDIAYKTGVTAGQNIYACTTADTWTQQGGAVSSPSTNGLAFWDGSALATTATGGSGTKCAISVAGATPVWGACSGTAATDWAALSDPSGALSLVMAHNPSTLTFDGTTSTIDGLKLVDTTSNTGTGNLFRASTASGSAMHPVRFDVNGAGVQMSTAGLLAAIGSGGISATHLSGTLLSGLATGILKNTTATGVPSIAIAADFPTLNQSTTGTAALATAIAGGSGGQVAFQSGAGVTAFSSGLAYNDTTKVLGLISGYTAGQSGTATGTYKINGTTSGTVTITGASASGTWQFTVPTSGGTNKYALTTDGSGVSSWAQIDLAAAVTGNLPVANLNSGTSASSSTFWRGDGTWATPSGGGNISTSGSPTTGALTKWASATTLADANLSGDATTSGTTAVTVTKVNGITISGTPSTGYVPTATGSTTATWQASTAGSGITSSCGTVTYNAGGTTTFDWTSTNCLKATASGGNTTLALTNPHGVGPYYLILVNDATARTWTLPGNLLQATVPSIASETVKFAVTYDGTNYVGDGSDEAPSTMRLDFERAAPATPAANKSVYWLDSTGHDFEAMFNASSNKFALVRKSVDVNTTAGQVTGINGTAISGTSGNVWTYGASNTAADAGFLATNVVRKDAANTWATGAQDFGSATSLKVPVGAGATTATNGFVAYDSTNNMLHAAQSGADAKVPQFTVTPTNAHCVTWVVSGSNYKLGDTACASGGGGGVNAQTANYTLVSGDSGMLVTMNGVSLTATLPASPPSSTWTAWIQNLAATALTVARNGLTINGGTSNITLQRYQWTIVYTDGTNYFAKPPTTAGANITLTMSTAAETIIGAAATGCAVGGASGDLQMNDGAGGCSASHLNDNGTTIKATEEFDLVANPETVEISNESGTGTTVNKIAKATGAPMTAIIATTADTTGEAIGIVVGGAGTTSSARIARNGIASCVFDGATTADHYVTVSSTVTGDCHDFGAAPPQDGSTIIGRVQSTNGSGGTYAVLLRPPTNGNGPNPMTAAGQFIYGGASGAPTALASGTGFLYANATSAPTIGKLARGIAFAIGDPAGSALTAASTTTDYITVPFACTISAYNLLVDAGTATVKFWKVATGTAIPTSGNSISTSGVAISSGTAIHSSTVSDFTSTTVTANDIMAMNVTAVATAKYVQGTLQCDQ